MNIENADVMAELERVLRGSSFRSRKTLRYFLQYIVQETLAGRGDVISQQGIATQGLGKSADFDPVYNPLVRIQAGRLRKQLEGYYADEGAANPLRISLPVGCYRPVFTLHKGPSIISRLLLENGVPGLSLGPSIACVARAMTDNARADWPVVARIIQDFTAHIARFHFSQVIFVDEVPSIETSWLDYACHKYCLDFILLFDLHAGHSGFELKCTLVHGKTRQLVWAENFALKELPSTFSEAMPLFKRIAYDALGYWRGVAHDVWARDLLASGEVAPAHKVLTCFRQYTWEMDVNTLHVCRVACEERLQAFPLDVRAMLIYSELLAADYLLKFGEFENPRERFMALAHRLAELEPALAGARLRLAIAHLFAHNYDACMEELQTALSINLLNGDINAGAGLVYCALDEWETGIPLIQETVSLSLRHPGWYHIPLSLHYYRQGDYADALREAHKVHLSALWGGVLRMVMYRLNGVQDKAISELGRLLRYYPDLMHKSNDVIYSVAFKVKDIPQHIWSGIQVLRSGSEK